MVKGQHGRKRSRVWPGATGALVAACLVAGAVAEASPLGSSSAAGQDAGSTNRLQAEFASAAQEFHVPEQVLLGLSYEQSLWDSHEGASSTTGNYNVMGLTKVDKSDLATPTGNKGGYEGTSETDAAGDGKKRPVRRFTLPASTAVDTTSPALHTLDAAAKLIGHSTGDLKTSAAESIRGGAALLAEYEKQLNGRSLPTDPSAWFSAVAEFSHASSTAAAKQYATRVYQVIRTGMSRSTADGQVVTLTADPSVSTSGTVTDAGITDASITGSGSGASNSNSNSAGTGTVTQAAYTTSASYTTECPSTLSCTYTPAAYQLDSTTDQTDYGNYALANRPSDVRIDSIVVHDTESTKAAAISGFQSASSYVSAHYVIGQDGSVTQMVPTSDMAWHSANKTYNTHSIGIEHEGWALTTNGNWYTPSEYQSSAALVNYLANRFGVPLDRQHIIGHDEVPGINDAGVLAQHWDPGTYWDWGYYFTLLGAPLSGNDQAVVGGTVTIAPPYSTSYEPSVYGCSANPCPGHPSNFVYLYKGPGTSYGLITDPLFTSNSRTTGSLNAADWTDKAVYGQTFVVAAISGSWTAVWYDGQQAWFYNPGGSMAYANTYSTAKLVTPAGTSAIHAWGVAFPESSAYPSSGFQPTQLSYTLQPGQSYLANDLITGDYYDSNTYYSGYSSCTAAGGCKDYTGTLQYYPIRYNHRIVFVKSTDVKLVDPVTPPTSTFVPVTPQRLLDTRSGTGAPQAKVAAGGSVALQITGNGPVPSGNVSAVVLNVTAVNPSAAGWVAVYPDGTSLPGVSNLNFTAGVTISNLVTVKVGSDGKVRLYNKSGSVDLLADVAGYYTTDGSGSHFVGYGPQRLLDTRSGTGAPQAKVAAGGSVALQITGNGSIPSANVSSVVLNVTAVKPSAGGWVAVYPDGASLPTVSNLNFTTGETIANLVTVKVGSDGKVRLYNKSGSVDLLADVAGYYTSDSGAVFHPATPVRVMDTRNGTGVRSGAVSAGGTVTLTVGASNGVPLNAKAVVLNVTAIAPTAGGYVNVYPYGSSRPAVSNINFSAGQTIPNLVVVPVVGGKVVFYNAAGSVNLAADLTGYFTG
ncbi:N-acetylmuramoyl-L-alanine amidase [Streptacidiphilus sp. EB103A]|uniref:N-acetylmuramoyl-L-alanine amidase n=1 Tax=Streptacidiphilus sp. EB103A TaxID=3156275 RepID=UPI0035119F75